MFKNKIFAIGLYKHRR